MNRVARIVAVFVAVTVLGFCCYGAWFTYIWGFNPVFLAPVFLILLAICAGILYGVFVVTKKQSVI